MNTVRHCPSCGGIMRRDVRNETVTFDGHSLTYQQPGWYCETGDDGVLDGPDNEFHDAALHEVMAQARKSPISPLVVRAAREALGVSQREAGRLFGGGPAAFHQYENAKTVPSAGMAALLHVALQHPDVVGAALREARGMRPERDVDLLRSAHLRDPLQALVRHIYPADLDPAAS